MMHGRTIVKAPADVTAELQPCDYGLVRFLAGHYAAGQKLPFKVS